MTARKVSPVDASGVVGRRILVGVLTATTIALAGCVPDAPAAPSPSASTPTPTSSGSQAVWSQEFDGPEGSPVSATEWFVEDSGRGFGNDELEAYTPRPENVSLDGNGSLRIRALIEDHVDPEGRERAYTSGRIETERLFRYGRIEARVKVPASRGLWSAFWLIGEFRDGIEWPATGEIDVMEYVNDATQVVANGWGDAADDDGRWSKPGGLSLSPGVSQEWHVYSVDWTPDSLEFSFDDVPFHRIDRTDLAENEVWRFDQPQAIILNLAVGGTLPGPPDDSSVFPAEMLVDYVRAYDTELHERVP